MRGDAMAGLFHRDAGGKPDRDAPVLPLTDLAAHLNLFNMAAGRET
jgi:hypothetical protein